MQINKFKKLFRRLLLRGAIWQNEGAKLKKMANQLEKYLFSLSAEEKDYILQDLPRWVEVTKNQSHTPFSDIWVKRQEFRSVISYRTKYAKQELGTNINYQNEIVRIIGAHPYLYVSNLYLSCSDIGPGLYIEHGFSTIIFAKKIGSNFWVNQNVTIGTGKGGNPTIENNVRVGANSVVIGNIVVQDDVKVGAGAVLNFDVPAGSTIVSQKPRVISPENRTK